MTASLLPLGQLGAIESGGTVTFGVLLPWVAAGDGNQVRVKVIHERDQFLQAISAREFPLAHTVVAPYGDYWSAAVPIAGTAPATPGSAWGQPGRYLYRYCVDNPNVGRLDWVIDPCARELGLGKQSELCLQLLRQGFGAVQVLEPSEQERLVEHRRAGFLVELEELGSRHAAREPGRDDRTGARPGDVVEEITQPEAAALPSCLRQQPFHGYQDFEREDAADAAAVKRQQLARPGCFVAFSQRPPE